MNFEEKLKTVVGLLKKFGIAVEMTEESIDALSEKTITDSILNNKTFTKELIDSATDAAKKEAVSTIINKLEKHAKENGVDVSEAKGDVKTIIAMYDKHIKTELGKTDEEKATKIAELHKKVQEAEIALENANKDFAEKETNFTTTLETTKSKLQRNYEDHSIFASLPLVESATKKSKEIFERLIAPELEGYSENEKGELMKDGKILLKHEILGGDKTTNGATRKDLIEAKAAEFSYIKETDTKSGGNGGANPNGGKPKPETGGIRKIDNYDGL